MPNKVINRPRFCPSRYDPEKRAVAPSFVSDDGSISWTPIMWCPADFPTELFEVAVSQLIHHPEYNSTLILRSEVVSESKEDFPSSIPKLKGFHSVQSIRRRLLPRRPGRDSGLEQYCTLYSSSDDIDGLPTALVLTPLVPPGESLPYYHPAVSHIAFRYISCAPAILQIEAVPLPGTPTDINSRLYRTCLALLETLHRYGWGAMTNYKKRVLHDQIIPRDTYQDLYLIMRERHKHLIETWQEVTDPLKHVFEDIGIGTFLMLLWKDMYSAASPMSDDSDANGSEPWRSWPRPPSGFLDLGCGNGLLVHILTAEGYQGYGIDLRARTSWSHYPESTQAQLRVEALDPTELTDPSSLSDYPYLRPGVFIIGNHADELTPWVPVLSTLCSASGYLSIPCCAWAFDTRYDRSNTPNYPIPVPEADLVESLNLGGDGNNTSSYSMYRIWLASLSMYCGWKVECENLRIPSTRNWTIIGRERTDYDPKFIAEYRRRTEEVIRMVRERGIFKTRMPEGKAGYH
ncbi:DUF1613-domain-containing protein [Laetiporus sulphureus 93-53]|uniref:tRNA (uracil-O(2)-)-methyltransferase n=1 Tax=Laetiporus sulphureus 93-53 TaxID=1314785 RepID=A0A165DZ31_9APHY|nr:DUF1613-domain-containing protein [Laetiporus sulphureus 93-53]KZT05928.1 DUF1613-domain-containing protein [Laetiporus sulphureus 93-53]